jgi:hypothetical protein
MKLLKIQAGRSFGEAQAHLPGSFRYHTRGVNRAEPVAAPQQRGDGRGARLAWATGSAAYICLTCARNMKRK